MACGCNKKGFKKGATPAVRPAVTRSNVVTTALTTTQLRAAPPIVQPTPPVNANELSTERNRTQTLRRNARIRSLGK